RGELEGAVAGWGGVRGPRRSPPPPPREIEADDPGPRLEGPVQPGGAFGRVAGLVPGGVPEAGHQAVLRWGGCRGGERSEQAAGSSDPCGASDPTARHYRS